MSRLSGGPRRRHLDITIPFPSLDFRRVCIERQVCPTSFHVALSTRISSIGEGEGGHGALLPAPSFPDLPIPPASHIHLPSEMFERGLSASMHTHTHPRSRPPPQSFATPLAGWQIDTAGGRQRLSLSETRCFLIPKATPGEEDWGTATAVMTCLVFQLLFPFCPPSSFFSDLPEAKLFLRPPFHLSSLFPFSSGRDDRSR